MSEILQQPITYLDALNLILWDDARRQLIHMHYCMFEGHLPNEFDVRDYGHGNIASGLNHQSGADVIAYLVRLKLVHVIRRDQYWRKRVSQEWEEGMLGDVNTYKNVYYCLTPIGLEVAKYLYEEKARAAEGGAK